MNRNAAGRAAARAAGMLLLLLSAACGSRPQSPAPAQEPIPRVSVEDRVGWYQVRPGLPVLLTFSAEGGLRLFALGDTLLAHRLVPVSERVFRWIPGQGAAEREIEFVGEGEATTAFAWTDAAGTPQRAPRLGCRGYEPRELAFRSGDVPLSGTLFVPCSGMPRAAAVMIHGSGESTRDNFWYMSIAHALAGHGIAVLLPDKRGSGKSGGDWTQASFADLARDAAAGVDAVQDALRMGRGQIGVVGLSQGGRIAPMVPQVSPGVGFVVNVSGAAVTPNEQVRHETSQTLRQSGWPGFLRPLARPIAVRVAKRRQREWWRLNGSIDPLPYWQTLRVPALVVFGARDELDNVPVRESVRRLREAGGGRIEIRVFEESGHALYAPGTQRIRPDFLHLLATWITARVGEAQE